MESIAIIGMGFRFPGANNPESFWKLLREGVDAITEIPSERWNIDEFYDPKPATPGKMITRQGGFLKQVDQFDPSFFGISPREAESIDPQQRLVLEVAWEALENAGIAPDKLSGSQTGVFIGIGNYDYGRLQCKNLSRLNAYDGPGTTLGVAANRLSYLLNLRGPSLVAETSCSSSLVAVHLACQSLHTRESNLCLVGGVSLMLSPESNIIFSHAQMMAGDDRCKTFDASADGYVRGEGAGVIVLKRLSEALRDEDNILAIVRGSAVNQDGLSNGLTAPNGPSQQDVIRKALENAGVAPHQISYVEAHGTGTSLGDPIEVKSLKAVLMEGRQPNQTCYIGSVKTNIGHLEPASGIAGLIKVVLSLQNKQIPPHLHLKQLNPYIKIENTPFAIPTELQKWSVDRGPRFAGVSAFGFGGTNAHVILEEVPAPVAVRTNLERSKHLLTLSAKSEKALQELAQSYEAELKSHPGLSLGDVCFTANTGRSHFNHRLAIVADSTIQLCEQLGVFATGKDAIGLVSGQLTNRKHPKIAFLFTGQGSQYIGMARQLYETQPVFHQALEKCNEILREYLEQPLLEILYQQKNSDLLDQTSYTQPALFAIEYALCQLWQSWGIQPDVVMGHSVGEYVAACVAGVFSLEDGLKLIAHRGRLMQALPANGKMVSVLADVATVTRAIESSGMEVNYAAFNGSESLVISGEQTQVDVVKASLDSKGIKTKELNVSHAFHSPLMEPMLAEFETIAKQVTYHSPAIPLISNVTGHKADESITQAEYWLRHVQEPVRFAQSLKTLDELGYQVFVEIGPKPVLLGMGRQCLSLEQGVWLPSLREGVDDWQQILDSLAQLYVQGVPVDWSGFDREYIRRKVVLPTYPFQRQRYWIEIDDQNHKKQLLSRSKTLHPLLGQKLHLELHLAGLEEQYRFESQISASDPAYLSHHRVFDQALLPTTAYLEIALAAGLNLFKSPNLAVEDVELHQGLILPEEEVKTLQTIITPLDNRAYQFKIFTQQQKPNQDELIWTLHAQGKIRTLETEIIPPAVDLQKSLTECEQPLEVAEYYQKSQQRGINYGVSFQGIQQLWRGSKQAVGQLQLPSELVEQARDYQLHPTLLDAALQVMGAAIGETNSDQTYLPVRIERFRVYRRPDRQAWAIASIKELQGNSTENLSAQVTLLSDDGETIAIVEGLRVKKATIQALRGGKSEPLPKNWLYEVQWRSQARFGKLLPPDYLLTPKEVEQKLSPTISELLAQQDLHSYSEMLTQLEELSVGYIVGAFKEMGWSYKPGEHFATETAAQRLGVVPSHRRLFNRLLQILAELGILDYNQQQWQVKKPLGEVKPEEKVETLLSKYPQIPAEITLLHRCASQLSSVLRGAIDAVELVFPQGDLTTVTHLYQESPSAKVMNTLVEKAIATALAKLPSDRGVRLLEIGAGTGGTTSYILPQLNPHQSEYVITDIGAFFKSKAQEKFRDYPFARYEILDIEVDPTIQGFEPHQYDVIVAANVLHATTSMSQTLSHVRQLLAPGGILVLLESTTRQRWLDLIFGLLEGWWKFSDWDLRPDYPLLSTSKWQQLLGATGFAEVSTLPQTEGTPKVLSQQAVILAQAELIESQITAPRGWLILSDQQGVAQELATQLRSQGEICTLVSAGEKFEQITPQEFTINPNQPEDFQQLVAHTAVQSPLYGVVQCWSLEAGIDKNFNAQQLEALSQLGCGTTLSLVQSLVKGQSQRPRLWLVTQGAQPVPANKPVIQGVAQSSLWGMGKVIALEHPELKCVRIDLDPNQTTEQQGKTLWSEIWSEDKEDQVALRENSRYVARLVGSTNTQNLEKQQQLKLPSQPFRLTTSAAGILENLTLETTTRHSPAPGEVEIQVRATGLNFLDVIAALGLLPQEVDGVSQKHLLDMDSFGGECAGEIVAIGEGVEDLKIGQAVIALAPGSFSQYVTVSATSVVPKPEHLSFEEAASIPVNFLTSYYALHRIAKIAPGERVLIHAAAGGTGMAAVQIAQLAGAEVFATASPGKWATLRSMGVKHIMNSRTVDFAEKVMEITQGQGVNIVLNSLTSGEFITKSLSVVSPQGRFVEIAKRGVWESAQMAAARPDVSYFVVDLASKSRQEPELIQSMLQEVINKFEKDLLQPPPLKVFPIQEVISAFRDMQQAKHIGKIVVSQITSQTDATNQMPLSLRAEGTYLITGGLGGLGLLVARWMVERGAKHLVLVGRSHPSDSAQRQLKELEAAGANVIVKQADVSEHEGMAEILADIKQSLPPLAGVIHSVGVLEDGVLQQQTWPRFAKVMNPKVQGAWNLHQLTKNQPLDFFVLFSSVASLLGSPAQANHSAANAFLDGLAYYRQALGLPALSINLGPVSQVGEAAERGADIRMQQKGIGAITPPQVLEALELLMKNSTAEVGVVPIEWSVLLEGASQWPFWADWRENTQTSLVSQPEFLQQLQAAMPSEQREMLVAYVRRQVAQVLRITDSQSISLNAGFFDLGMDSLTSVELRNCLQTSLGCSMPSTVAFDYPTVGALVDYLTQQVLRGEASESDITEPEESKDVEKQEQLLVTTQDLSEDQLEELINQKLNLLIHE